MGFQDRDYVKEKHQKQNAVEKNDSRALFNKSIFTSMIKKCDHFITMIVTLVILGCIKYFFFPPMKVATFDIKGTTNTFLKQVATLNIDESQKNAMVKRYNTAMDSVIKEYEAQHYIILVKDAVISPVEDKTSDIQRKIAQKMKNNKDR